MLLNKEIQRLNKMNIGEKCVQIIESQSTNSDIVHVDKQKFVLPAPNLMYWQNELLNCDN